MIKARLAPAAWVARCSELIAIHIKPAPALQHKAAALMQAHGLAGCAHARDKLDFGSSWPGVYVSAHFQPQPTGAGIEI
jgi:hypothetical protein